MDGMCEPASYLLADLRGGLRCCCWIGSKQCLDCHALLFGVARDGGLEIGGRVLQRHLDHLRDPAGTYLHATPAVRRDLNIASFTKLWIDEGGIRRGEKTDVVQELHNAAIAYGDTVPAQPGHFVGCSSNVAKITENVGFTTKIILDPKTQDDSIGTAAPLLEDLVRGTSSKDALVH